MCGGEAVRVEQDRCAFTGLWSDSPHYRFHARNHFTRTERFANVVVRAEIETQQAVDFLDAGGENDDGNVGKSPHSTSGPAAQLARIGQPCCYRHAAMCRSRQRSGSREINGTLPFMVTNKRSACVPFFVGPTAVGSERV